MLDYIPLVYPNSTVAIALRYSDQKQAIEVLYDEKSAKEEEISEQEIHNFAKIFIEKSVEEFVEEDSIGKHSTDDTLTPFERKAIH